ncbi:RING finger and SPRY domain-containing protein 1-like [Clavelina lepadiformis]|uniref:RING finger and SPRY domain-containing protein 1-like n=1 Tax=Clavelina lepadiformis TaxID=159417 RepID=UPI004042A621
MGNCYHTRSTPVHTVHDGAELDEDDDMPYMLVLNNNSSQRSPRAGSHRWWRRPFRNRNPRNDFPDVGGLSCYRKKLLTEEDLDEHVIETLSILRNSAENDTTLIFRMRMFRHWANGEIGWNMVLSSLVRAVPLDDVLGPSAITLFIDHCPIPTKRAVLKFVGEMNLSRSKALEEFALHSTTSKSTIHRNVCAVLGHLAESLAGPLSSLILTDDVLDYFFAGLDTSGRFAPVTNTLYSLIALEKFSQTGTNKEKIMERNIQERLSHFEGWSSSNDHKKRQVGFLSRWLLDNSFIKEGRTLTYETVQLDNINSMLNSNDVSEYLKLSADCLEARSDASSFESVRCTFSVDHGVWYYEVTIVTPGVMQIGWATKRSKFFNYDGYGIGDDEFSCAYDGCRQLYWHTAQSHRHSHPPWREGDTLGSLLDVDACEVVFFLNGVPLPAEKEMFNNARNGFFAAASFMSHQQCIFNFGAKEFKFPPKDREFLCFNDHASLTAEQKLIIPKHKKMELLQRMSIGEDCCDICCDQEADTILKPCGHGGVCMQCAAVLEICPLCREEIVDRGPA